MLGVTKRFRKCILERAKKFFKARRKDSDFANLRNRCLPGYNLHHSPAPVVSFNETIFFTIKIPLQAAKSGIFH